LPVSSVPLPAAANLPGRGKNRGVDRGRVDNALIDAGVLDGLAQDSRAALKKAHKYMSDCLASIQADANIQELLNWVPSQG
jgi:hypothetical protein